MPKHNKLTRSQTLKIQCYYYHTHYAHKEKKKQREKERETSTILLIINDNGKQTNPSPNHLKKLASRSCGRRIWRLRRPKDYTIRT
jgi:hypothetical protein